MLRDKRILITLAVVLLIIGTIFLITFITKKPTTGIEFIVVPDKVTAKIDGKNTSVSYESAVGTKTGTVTVELSKDGFESKSATVEVKEGSLASLYVYLNPLTDAAKKEVATTIMQQRIERIGGHMITESSKKMEEKYPFINKLPIIEKYYTITPCSVDPSDPTIIGICVNLAIDKQYYRDLALVSLSEKGITPSDWTVLYMNQFDHSD